VPRRAERWRSSARPRACLRAAGPVRSAVMVATCCIPGRDAVVLAVTDRRYSRLTIRSGTRRARLVPQTRGR